MMSHFEGWQHSDNENSNHATNYRRLIISVVVIAVLAVIAFGIWLVHDLLETRRLDETSVVLSNDLTAEFGSEMKISDYVWHLEGSMVNDTTIDTTQLGPITVEFQYYNSKNKKRTKQFTVNVVDTTKPTIYGQDLQVVNIGHDGVLTDLMLSGDNFDDHPTRKVNGQYDLGKAGDYALEYIVSDSSGNTTHRSFTLRVVEPIVNPGGQISTTNNTTKGTPITEIIDGYKNDNVEIGIDVSSWQGEIDWAEAKAAGVEFAMIRAGYQVEYGGEYILDKYFQKNIAGATAVGLPVGVYFYSCANSVDEANNQAKWVLEQVGDYPLELGVAFDWEEWGEFNHAGMSFYTLQKAADAFLGTIENAGYSSMLYGSKNYLERFWQRNTRPVWLAQYYDRPTYNRDFQMWQLADTGIVPGIDGYVDLDIRYK